MSPRNICESFGLVAPFWAPNVTNKVGHHDYLDRTHSIALKLLEEVQRASQLGPFTFLNYIVGKKLM